MIILKSLPGLLTRIGYSESSINDIMCELENLFVQLDFNKIIQKADSAREAKDTEGLIACLKELMLALENKGFYRPDFPVKLIKLLVNGLNLKNEDIFMLLDKAGISQEEKSKEQEFLASCAAITQLGYILLLPLVNEVKAASSGPHVFLFIDGFSQRSLIFVDFSIDSIREIDIKRYDRKNNSYYLKNPNEDNETAKLTEYYSSFHVTSGIGLSHNIHNNLGIAYEKIGMYERSIDELNEALRLDPDYIEVHNNLAVTYDKMEKVDEAINELREVLRLNPDHAEAHSNLGNIHAKLGNYEEAIGELKQALVLKPNNAIAHNNLGHVYAIQNRNEEALKEFKEALRIDPDYAPSHNNIADIYAFSGKNEDALAEFQEALRLSPQFPEAYQGIGSVYYRLGSYDRAAQAWIRAVYLEPQLLECVPDKLILKVRQGVARLR